MFTAIIDDGLPGAAIYYRTFLAEPSPLGTIEMESSQIRALNNPDLLALLRAMAAPSASRDILLVCHAPIAGEPGLLLPLVGKSGSAGKEALELLIKAETWNDTATDIIGSQASEADKVAKWKQLFDTIQKDASSGKIGFRGVTGTFTSAEAKTFWEGSVLPGIASTLGISKADLLRLFEARRACVQRKLERLEIRACDVGGSPDVMDLIRRYFGCKKVTAPKLETFYHSGVGSVAINPRRKPQLACAAGSMDSTLAPGRGLWRTSPSRLPWDSLLPLTYWVPVLPDPLADAAHRKAVGQVATFDVKAEMPELAERGINVQRGGERQRPVDIAANGAHKQVGFGVVLFVWEFRRFHFDALLAVARTHSLETFPPRAPSGPDLALIDEFVQERINKRGFPRGLKFLPIAGL